MKISQIRKTIGKGLIEKAISEVVAIAETTELEDDAETISTNQRMLERKKIKGILDHNQIRQEEAIITDKLLILLREFEILQIKELNEDFTALKNEIKNAPDAPEAAATTQEIEEIREQMAKIQDKNSPEEVNPSFLERVGNFIEKCKDPDSGFNKTIRVIKNGAKIVERIALKYGSLIALFL